MFALKIHFCSENCSRSYLWICFTCHRKMIAGNIPPEAATNNMHIKPVPKELSCLKQNNKWYEGITINNDIDALENNEYTRKLKVEIEAPDEDNDEPQQISVDTCLQPVDVAQKVIDHFLMLFSI